MPFADTENKAAIRRQWDRALLIPIRTLKVYIDNMREAS